MAQTKKIETEPAFELGNTTAKIFKVCHLRAITSRPCPRIEIGKKLFHEGIIPANITRVVVTNKQCFVTHFCDQSCFDKLNPEQRQAILEITPIKTRKHPLRGAAGFKAGENKQQREKLGSKLENLRNLIPPKL